MRDRAERGVAAVEFVAPRRARDQRGVAAVEFALVMPVLVALILGILTSGIAYSQALGVTNAVREGSRFGATADATSSAWSDNVIQRVRDTQFDDPDSQATICVQLWKVGTGEIPGTVKCSPASGGAPISIPALATADPAVPANSNGTCVVRVLAARPFTINVGVDIWESYSVRGSVARYERRDKIPTCL